MQEMDKILHGQRRNTDKKKQTQSTVGGAT